MDSQISSKLKQLLIKPSKSIINNDLYINLTIRTPEAPAVRAPVSIICALDISGSMATSATQAGGVQSDGFSRLDLVKHSVNTIINCLSQNDVLGIITFSDNARIEYQPNQMTEVQKKKAMNVIQKMQTQGSTNLWDGIKNGLDLSQHQKCKTRNTFLIVLSDGQPNVTPGEGEVKATINYIKKNPLRCNMSMFGYGYNLNTQLLAALTQVGGGCFGYIPDCSMIGTIFINFLSYALASFAAKLQAEIHCQKGVEVSQFNSISNTNVAHLGAIQYGVTRNLLIKFKGIPKNDNVANVDIYFNDDQKQKMRIAISNKIQVNEIDVKIQRIRCQHITMLNKSLLQLKNNNNNIVKVKNMVQKHLQEMKNLGKLIKKDKEVQFIQALIRDIQSDNANQGQVMIALKSVEFWKKWGIHYFYALKIAHANEMCSNFKDPGLQLYGGQLFKNLQNTMDTVFINLPPPKPSIPKYNQNGNVNVVQNMANYYDVDGGCIYGECEVKMADGTTKKVKELKKGDIVEGLQGPTVIKCVIKTQVNQNINIVKFPSGLIITKYHPVYFSGKWVFPINEATVINMYVSAYYNFVLEFGYALIVNNIPCISLGHGLQGDVVKHQYFGTDAILYDLSRINGWNQGYVTIGKKAFKRDPVTQQVIGLIH